MSDASPTEEQLLEALRQIKIEDVVVQTVVDPGQPRRPELIGRGGTRIPSEAKEAIDAARALLPLCPGGGESRRSRTRSPRSRCSTCRETVEPRRSAEEPPPPESQDLDAAGS